MTTLLETKHLILRELEESDLDALYTIVSDPDVMRYVEDGKPLTREQTANWIALSQQNYLSRGYDEYAVVAKSSGELIGWCGLVTPTTAGGDAEISYGFAKAAWGKGYGMEAARAMLNWAFDQLGLDTILGTVDPANAASIQIFKRLGMEYLRFEMDEHNLPTLVYAVLNVERLLRDLENSREKTIKQIYDAFKVTLRNKRPSRLTQQPNRSWAPETATAELEELLTGKRWDEVIDSRHLVYDFSDIDFITVISDEAYLYYLPAFLIRVTKEPEWWIYYHEVLVRFVNLAAKFTVPQVEALIAFLDFVAKLYCDANYAPFIEALEDTQLRLMLHLDGRKQKKAKP